MYALLILLMSISLTLSINGEVLPITAEPNQLLRVNYTIWISEHFDQQYNMELIVPEGTTLYTIMNIAAWTNSLVVFEYKILDNIGHYVTKIAGVSNNPDRNQYWLLYVLPESPNMRNPPTSEFRAVVGIDNVRATYDAQYLFWYKTLDDQVHER